MRTLIFVLMVISGLLTACSRSPEKITWEIRKGTRPEDIGWNPKGATDISFSRDGDFDFTLIEYGADGSKHEFHQRCWSIGAERVALGANQNSIDHVYAHFGKDVSIEAGLELAKQVLMQWDQGLRDPPAKGELTLEEFRTLWKQGSYHQPQWGLQGRESGVVNITLLNSTDPDRMKWPCRLTFWPG